MKVVKNYENLTFLVAEYDDEKNTSISVFCDWDTPELTYVVCADSVTIRGNQHDIRRWLILTGHNILAGHLEDPKGEEWDEECFDLFPDIDDEVIV